MKQHFLVIAVCETNIDSNKKVCTKLRVTIPAIKQNLLTNLKNPAYIKDDYTFDTISESSVCSPDIMKLYLLR